MKLIANWKGTENYWSPKFGYSGDQIKHLMTVSIIVRTLGGLIFIYGSFSGAFLLVQILNYSYMILMLCVTFQINMSFFFFLNNVQINMSIVGAYSLCTKVLLQWFIMISTIIVSTLKNLDCSISNSKGYNNLYFFFLRN